MRTPPTLARSDLPAEPVSLFQRWWTDARAAVPGQATAVVLATASAGGVPSARVVLLKQADERGFVFYSNYESRKARDLIENNMAAMTLHWAAEDGDRQVRVEGDVEQIPGDESDAYFRSRARESQLGAWASAQSRVIGSRAELEERLAEETHRWEGVDVPRPPHWGGYVLRPLRVEFWLGRAHRLHDRVRYERQDEGWRRERLAP